MNDRSVVIELDQEDGLIELFDEDFMYIPDLAKELGMPVRTIRKMIDYDPELGKPGSGSEFPNAFKERAGNQTARIRVPVSDVRSFKIRTVKGEPPLGRNDNGEPLRNE